MKKKEATKAQRELHHSRWTILWMVRSSFAILMGYLLFKWNPDYSAFSFLLFSGAAVAWIYAWVHSQLEITCDKGDEDCKDQHVLGQKNFFLKSGKRLLKGKKPNIKKG